MRCGRDAPRALDAAHAASHTCRVTARPSSSDAFPDGFVWGAATAAHQVEGGNWNNDWWAWEHGADTPCREPSGDACDHYHRYPDDLDLLAGLGFGAYRFSLEWSRIEPEDGEFSAAALDHYRRVCDACLARGLAPIVTFHHFTTPRWVAARGGWTEPATADVFARFAARAAARLGDVVARVCTINEPNIVADVGHRWGLFPPGARDPGLRLRANEVLIGAHRLAVDAIRSAPGRAPIGLTLAMQDWQAVDGGEALRDRERRDMEDVFLEAARGDDFLGVQTYTRTLVGPDGPRRPAPDARLTQMGWEFYPDALEACVRRAHALTGAPIVVTENGVAVDEDRERVEYVARALRGVRACLADGIPVLGYLYWSLLDNFEWAFGYAPRFGIVEVDRATQRRTPRPSAHWLGSVARANRLLPVP
ncbi:MAG: family 1 glycosylhydrolase [Deltaproteobacteria bacterium]|nr:family 1 glycosylhydrolase [Deltaproteobacteria bacterium]